MSLCGIQNDLTKDKIDGAVDILYVRTSKGSSEIENKKATGKE
jgi:hypothetical protein